MHPLGPFSLPAVLATSLLLPVAVAAAGGPLSATDLCSKASLNPRPAWLSAAVWVPSAGKILAVDSGLNRLVLYSPTGKGAVVPEPEREKPALLARSGDRFLLKLVGRDVVSLDANVKDPRPSSLLKGVTTPLGQLNAVYQWAGVDHSVLAFGLVRGANLPRGFQPGLFRLPPEGASSAAELLKSVDSWDYYLLGYQYLTSIGDTGYFLDMDQGSARLYEIPPGAAPRVLVDAVPPDVRSVPPINSEMNGPMDAPALYAKLEQLKMVTGIYGGTSDGKLYLLAREPAPRGTTNWWLFRIDPKLGQVVGKALLPTTAQHLTVVTSPDTFYLIERGDVDATGAQAIGSLIAVPLSLVEQAPLRGSEICSDLRE